MEWDVRVEVASRGTPFGAQDNPKFAHSSLSLNSENLEHLELRSVSMARYFYITTVAQDAKTRFIRTAENCNSCI